ncbi:MAG: hypothetical protein II575_08935 [Bacteroidales bacterium]|nr:hypothetical protein [Bacteroidales bacterium]
MSMNKCLFILVLSIFTLLCSHRGISQTNNSIQECGYEELMNRYKAQGCQLYSEKPIGNRDDETIYKIPVVFHVVIPPAHSGNAFEYLAPNKIYDCLNILDMIFAGASPFDTVNILSVCRIYYKNQGLQCKSVAL